MSLHTPTPAPDTPVEHLAGTVERVTCHSEETGFCVLRVKVRGHRDLFTYVGKFRCKLLSLGFRSLEHTSNAHGVIDQHRV